MRKLFSHFAVLVLFFSAFVSCSKKDNPVVTDSGSTLTAFKLASDGDAPDINSPNIEPAWNVDGILTINPDHIGDNFTGGPNPTQISIQSVVSSKNIYFLLQYDDPDPDYLQQPLHFHGGNPVTPTNWSVDASTYDDGVSMIFEDPAHPGMSGSKSFTSDGCTMLCHTTTTAKWDKGMFAETEGRYDLWYWHAGKGNGSGYADDKISIGAPNFGIIKDDDNAEIYHNNVINDNPGSEPFYVAKGANRGLDKRYFIAEETAQLFANGITINPATNKAWAANDIVPAYSLALPTDASNDYFDVHAKGYWSNGKWTVKFQRKLTTVVGNNDVQFSHGSSYLFSFAIHNNNAPGNHHGAASKSFKLTIQ